MASSIINVKNYGTLGAGQDTSIFQQALDAVPSQGGTVVYPAPVYVPTGPLTISKHRTHVIAAGIYATGVYPAAGFSGKVFDFTNGESILFQCSLKGWGFVGAGTNQKTAICTTDVSGFKLEDVAIYQSWTGNGSIGWQIKGRDTYAVKNLTISADIPISIEDNPNHTIDFDQSHFENLYLTTQLATGAAIQIAPNINLTNITMDGYVSFCKGKYGIYCPYDTGTGQISSGLVFDNVRFEQADDLTGQTIYIDHDIYSLSMRNCWPDPTTNGAYFRKVKNLSLQNYIYSG